MVATLGLTSQITPSSISVNTANGDHMGVAGDVHVNFKIGRKFSFTHNFVVCEKLSHPFIIWITLHEETLHVTFNGYLRTNAHWDFKVKLLWWHLRLY